jgi:putative spermidine/putrescine transport system permease protein
VVSGRVGRSSERSRFRPRSGPFLLVLPALAFLALAYLLPLVSIGLRSVTDPPGVGADNFFRFFESDAFTRALLTTLRTAATVTILTLLIGYPYAYLITISSRWVSRLLLLAVLLPFFSSLLVRTYAWSVILRDTGIVNGVLTGTGLVSEPIEMIRTPIAVHIGLTHVLLPFMVLPLYSVMQRIDPDLGAAARNLGAGPWRSFWRIFVPLSLPGVLAGSLLVFVLTLGYFITPSLLGGPRDQLLGELIVNQVSRQLDWGMGSAMAVILAVLTLAGLFVAALLVRVPDPFGSRPNE